MVPRPRLRPPRQTTAQALLHLASGAHGRRRRPRDSLRGRRAATAAGLDRRPAALAPHAAWSAARAAPTRARGSLQSRPWCPGLCSQPAPQSGRLEWASAPCSLVSQSSHPSFPAILADLNGIFLYLNGIFFCLYLNGVLFFLLEYPKLGDRPGRRLRLTRSGVRRSSTGLARGHSPAPGSSRVARRDPTCCSRLREVRADRSRSASPESGRHPQELA